MYSPDIKIIKEPIGKDELLRFAESTFGDMAKIVVDVEQKIMAIGAELHAEAESLLMEREGSKRKDTWGLNIYPGKPTEEWLEFDSMVNIKPAHGNRSRKIESEEARSKVAAVVNGLIKI